MNINFADNVLSEMFDLYRNKKLRKKIERMLQELERNPQSAKLRGLTEITNFQFRVFRYSAFSVVKK